VTIDYHANVGIGRDYSAAILGTWKPQWQAPPIASSKQFVIDNLVRVRRMTEIPSPIPHHRELGLTYTAVLEEDEDGGFVATVPALRGCISQGDNQEDALAHLRDALEGWIEVAQHRGLNIPAPDGARIQ
jgi:antitoxin HicB